jgi:L-lactate dehydrogenase complex protein LldF
MRQEEKFKLEIQKKIAEIDFRQHIGASLAILESRRKDSLSCFNNLELAKLRAAYTKWKVNENLDKFLIDFEGSIVRKGGKVIWAYDISNAQNEVLQIIQKQKAEKIIRSKSILAEEIELDSFLNSKGINHHLADVSDYILKQTKKIPYNFITPTIEDSFSDVKNKLNQSIRVSLDADESEMLSDIKEELRSEFLHADLAITGANFLIADSGLVAISEDSGAARLSFAFAKTHIVLAGIDQIIPGLNELDLFLSLYSTHSKGKVLQSFSTITGPRDRDDFDGPAEFIVILIDNGRSEVLASQDQRQALSCIDCGACNNVCPVYKTIGGNNTYLQQQSGPIGQVIQPLKAGLDNFGFLSNHTTFCGKCTDVCPVNIDIHNHLLRNRRDFVNQGFASKGDKLAWYSWNKLMLSRKNLNRQTTLRNFTFKSFFKKDWGEEREFPKIVEKTFNQIWREQKGL